MMRVLITGGSGLIGRALVSELIKHDHEVIVLSRRPERVGGLPPGALVAAWDGRTARGWEDLADGAGVIVNLAGTSLASGRWTDERKQTIRESRVNAGRAIVEAVQLVEHKPRVILQSSAVGYYGSRGNEELDEQSSPGRGFLPGVCLDWEASTAPVVDMGVRQVVIRSGVVFSRQGGALPLMVLPFRLFVGGRLGSGRQWISWIHQADEAAAIRFLIEHETASGVFNLASPHPVTNREFARFAGRVLGRPSLLPAPALALRAILGEMSETVLEGQRVAPGRLLQLGFAFRFPDLHQALEDLL